MKLLSVIVVLSMASTASLQAQDSLPIGTVTVTGLGQAVADGDLCLGPNGATSFGGIITYDGEEFECVSGKTLTGKSLAGWVSISSIAQSVDIKESCPDMAESFFLQKLKEGKTLSEIDTPKYINILREKVKRNYPDQNVVDCMYSGLSGAIGYN